MVTVFVQNYSVPVCAPRTSNWKVPMNFSNSTTELQRLADKYAPAKKVTIKWQRLAAWMDEECRTQLRLSRMLEHRYRQNKTEENCRAWVEQERLRHQLYRQKERSYWSVQLIANAGESRKLWRSMQQILGKQSLAGVSNNCPTAQQLLEFFEGKIEGIRQSTGGSPVLSSLPDATSSFMDLQVFSMDEVKAVIMKAPAKSCSLDPIPTSVLKQFLPELLPFLTDMCNASLSQGYLPVNQRHAIISPRIKKVGADATDTKNYRPVSNLTFMSKIVERLVCQQLVSYLEVNQLLPKHQSA